MQLGMIGLGRMGGNIVRRLMQRTAIAASSSTRAPTRCAALAGEGATPSRDLADFVGQLDSAARGLGHAAGRRRSPTARSSSCRGLLERRRHRHRRRQLASTRTISAHAEMLQAKGIRLSRCRHQSGGVWGLERGYCMMIGGDKAAVEHSTRSSRRWRRGAARSTRTPGREGRDPRAEQGYLHCGPGRRRAFRQDGP